MCTCGCVSCGCVYEFVDLYVHLRVCVFVSVYICMRLLMCRCVLWMCIFADVCTCECVWAFGGVCGCVFVDVCICDLAVFVDVDVAVYLWMFVFVNACVFLDGCMCICG